LDEGDLADYGVFANADEAIVASKEIVDDELDSMWKAEMIAKELCKLYVAFGPDPFVVPLNSKDPRAKLPRSNVCSAGKAIY
jgi:hypothetical protein